MQLEALTDLAMVLPLPVPENSAADAVKFINLERYPRFFNDLEAGFAISGAPALATDSRLQVVDVGIYEASYVPTIADFQRLDRRFQFPAGVWNSIPEYKSLGFAVFKLKPNPRKQSVHPMAFLFPRKNREEIFFPTVHIHDGEFHKTAEFDHVLYLQTDGNPSAPMENWVESMQPAGMFMNAKLASGLIDLQSHIHMSVLIGDLPNRDTVIA